jgi:hypothetical protein
MSSVSTVLILASSYDAYGLLLSGLCLVYNIHCIYCTQIDLRMGRPDLVHEVLQTIEINSGIPLMSSAVASGDTSNSSNSKIPQIQRSHSSFFTMNLGCCGTSKVAHDAAADDNDGASTVLSYGIQTLSIASSALTTDAFQVGNNGDNDDAPKGSVSAGSNSSR